MRAVTAGVTLGLALAFALAGAGCKQASSDYCDSNKPACPDGLFCDTINRVCLDEGPACDPQHPCVIPDLPACVGGMCVQCDSPDDCADNPFPGCDPDNMCTGLCTTDADCDMSSSVCMPDGSCAAVDAVLYTAPAPANPMGECISTDPCDLEYAVNMKVDEVRHIVHLAPMQYDTGGPLAPAHDVVMIGRNATIRYNGGVGNAIVANGGHRVEIDFLAVRDANGTTPLTGNGVFCDGGATVVANGMRSLANDAAGVGVVDCMVELTGVEIDGNSVDGINVNSNNAMLDVTSASIHDNVFVGIEIVLGRATVRRSIVRTNFHGGIEMGGPTPGTVENSIIVGNGSGAGFGGIRFLFQDDNVFRFNVVSANVSPSGASGMQCGNPVLGFNNILDDDVNAANCVNNNSIFTTNAGASSGTPIMTGIDPAALFLNTSNPADPNYYHLKATAVAKDFGAAQPDVLVDIDGQPRQFGSASDSGADEVQQ
jgi:hypothetical protein